MPSDEYFVRFVDNYDSFTYNLVEYVSEHAHCDVVTNIATPEEVTAGNPDAIVVSPGPGHPATERDVGVSTHVFSEVATKIPTLGVCLGLESAVYVYGGTIDRAPEPVHGKASPITHDETGVFRDIPQAFQGGRYHSLMATSIPSSLKETAWTEHDGERLVMGVRHQEFPIECVQFHPESVLTAVGHDIIENFLQEAQRYGSGNSVWEAQTSDY